MIKYTRLGVIEDRLNFLYELDYKASRLRETHRTKKPKPPKPSEVIAQRRLLARTLEVVSPLEGGPENNLGTMGTRGTFRINLPETVGEFEHGPSDVRKNVPSVPDFRELRVPQS